MPCLIGCLALLMPRVALILVAVFSDYLGRAYDNLLWPILGFFFLPLTTLAFAWARNDGGGEVGGVGLIAVILAVLIDLGLLGTGEASRRRRAES